MTANLYDMLNIRNIKIGLESSSKDEVIEEMAGLVLHSGKIKNKNELVSKIREREEIQSTGIGENIAIMHAKYSMVNDIEISLGISKKGIEFRALDNKPVKIFFLIVSNDELDINYLHILSHIARLFRNREFKKDIINLTNKEDIIKSIKNAETEFLE